MNDCTHMVDNRTLLAVLAAGRAQRFGGGKLDALCAGRALGEWATGTAEAAGFASRIIVVADDRPAFVSRLKGWMAVPNPNAASEGLASSIQVAARAASGYTRLIVVLADMPLMESAHLKALVETDGVAFTGYPDGSRGVPAAFPARHFEALAAITSGAASANWGEEIKIVSPSSACSLFDVDTPTDLNKAETMLARRSANLSRS